MSTIDAVNWVGRKRSLWPLGFVLHGFMRRLSLSQVAALAGRRLGGPIYGACLAGHGGASVRENLSDGRVMFRTIERFVNEYKPDLCLCDFADLSAEAEACGCEVKTPEDALPSVTGHPVGSLADLKALRTPDPHRDGRLHVFIEAARLFAKRFQLLAIAAATGINLEELEKHKPSDLATLAGEVEQTNPFLASMIRRRVAAYEEFTKIFQPLKQSTETPVS